VHYGPDLHVGAAAQRRTHAVEDGAGIHVVVVALVALRQQRQKRRRVVSLVTIKEKIKGGKYKDPFLAA
jgi:hypothetical protein